jgi:hypothetical protein
MAASARPAVATATRRLPTRIRIAVPQGGLGTQLSDMMTWLDANCGAGQWAMTPAGLHGVVNDAIAIDFLDAAHISAFVDRWCIGFRVEKARESLAMS